MTPCGFSFVLRLETMAGSGVLFPLGAIQLPDDGD